MKNDDFPIESIIQIFKKFLNYRPSFIPTTSRLLKHPLPSPSSAVQEQLAESRRSADLSDGKAQ